MKHNFGVGEIALVGVGPRAGQQCTVIETPSKYNRCFLRHKRTLRAGRYLIASGDELFQCRPEALRKFPGQNDGRQVTRWAECPWQPAGVRA